QSMIEKFIAALGWILDVHIPPEVGQIIQNSLVAEWSSGNAKTISEAQKFVSFYDQVSMLNLETRDAIREEHQAEFVASLRAQGNDSTHTLIFLYDRTNIPMAMGTPPLTREIANCYFDLIGLVQSLQMGVEWRPLPDQVKLSYTQVLATQYPVLHPAQQAW